MSIGYSERRRFAVAALIPILAGLSASRAAAQPAAGTNQCAICHGTQTDARLATPAALFSRSDVHRDAQFTCADCHGGDAAAAQQAAAHDPARGFKGKPAGQAEVAACARCHSDTALMRRFAPRAKVGQAAEYAASAHGRRLAAGDPKVATCSSCHGAHGIRRVGDAQSPVFRTNVAGTCASCHSNAQHMAGYTGPGGAPMPTNQLAEYEKSEHHRALTKGGDAAAPTCNNCHGNHGPAPAGVDSVVNICGTCHASFAQKFDASPHRDLFDRKCVECHGNHAVLKTSDAMLGTGAGSLCGACHEGPGDKGAAAADAMRTSLGRLSSGIVSSQELIARLGNAGIEVGAEELALAEARSQLTLARTELHASQAAPVVKIADDGLAIVRQVEAAGRNGVAELQFRRRGLALSLAAILTVVVALWLKVRQIDRRNALRSGSLRHPAG